MGKKYKPQYTDEFKREALRLLKTSGRSKGEVADDLGIMSKTCYTRWQVDAWRLET